MSTCKLNNNPFLHKLNDELTLSEKYSHCTNILFKDLVIPPGLSVKKDKTHNQSIYICNNKTDHSECIDKKLYSELVKLAQIDSDNITLKTKKNKSRKKKISDHKKDIKTKKISKQKR